jgi:RNA polymerase sigma-70 factor (ECF subfamily)
MDMTQAKIARKALDGTGDAELVRFARDGSAAAFRAIMERHNRRLFRAVRSVLKDEAEAEDALQDAYLQAFTNLDGFRGEAELSTWLMRIALNEAFGRLRRGRRASALNDQIEAGMGVIVDFPFQRTAAADPERLAAGSEIRRLLESAIDELPDAFRTVFVLRCVEQLSVEETAAALGVPEETVKTRLHRARGRLQATIHRQLAGSLDGAFPFGGARCARVSAAVLRRLGYAEPPPGAA